MSSGKNVIFVRGYFENRSPYVRKAFQETRRAPETVVEEAEDSQPEFNQANMETKEGSEGINARDEDLAKFEEHSDIMGKTVKTFNENIDSFSKRNSPNKGRGTRKSTKNLVDGVIVLDSSSATPLISSNPNPTRTKGKWKKQAHTKASGENTQSRPICGKRVRVDHRLVSKDDGGSLNSMVEAVHQSLQLQ